MSTHETRSKCKCPEGLPLDVVNNLFELNRAVFGSSFCPVHQRPQQGLTDEEVLQIDGDMNQHMYHHTIANTPSAWACDTSCRMDALRTAINRVLLARE